MALLLGPIRWARGIDYRRSAAGAGAAHWEVYPPFQVGIPYPVSLSTSAVPWRYLSTCTVYLCTYPPTTRCPPERTIGPGNLLIPGWGILALGILRLWLTNFLLQDIFDLHEPNCRALVNDFAPTPQRLAEIRNVAEKLLHQYLPADKVADILREHNSPIGTQDSAQHSSNFDDNIYEEYIASSTTLQQPASPGSKAPPATNNKRKRTRITPQTSSALPASQSASQSASPWASPWASPSTSPSTSSSIPDPPLPLEETAPVKRGRGRPKKKEGDPKGPYTRRKPVSERAPNKRQKRGEDSN